MSWLDKKIKNKWYAFMKIILKIVTISLMTLNIQAGCADIINSLIIAPRIGETVVTGMPVIIGVMKNKKNRAIKNKPVSIYLDERLIAVVETNQFGAWSYMIKKSHALSNGFHSLQASAKLTLSNSFWAKSTLFYVQAAHASIPNKSCTVSNSNSHINFPFDMSFINTARPLIIGSLSDSTYFPVAGETVIIQIDGSTLANVTSDSNGVFYYAPMKDLPEGSHTIDIYCVESEAELTSCSFTIDTEAPYAPTITNPAENTIITDRIALVSGSSEPSATIATFLDSDRYGEINYCDEAGSWSIEYEVEDGDHSVTAQATDLAGNTGPMSEAILFTAVETIS